jgi:hypothetical protein
MASKLVLYHSHQVTSCWTYIYKQLDYGLGHWFISLNEQNNRVLVNAALVHQDAYAAAKHAVVGLRAAR